MKQGVPELSTVEAKKFIDDAQKLGITILAFTGGEPLLRKDIYELIAHVDARKAMPIMFTNGELLTEKNADLLAEAGLYSIFVSIDNPNPEEHDKLRRKPGVFEAAIKGLQRMKERGVFVGLSSYATRSGTEKGMYKKLHEFAREIVKDRDDNYGCFEQHYVKYCQLFILLFHRHFLNSPRARDALPSLRPLKHKYTKRRLHG